jgi:uncharacterized protein YjbI with pentapeptide repeats
MRELGCDTLFCDRRAYRDAKFCVLHIPKKSDDLLDTLLVEEFDREFDSYMQRQTDAEDVDCIYIDGLIFPTLAWREQRFAKPIAFRNVQIVGDATLYKCVFEQELTIGATCLGNWRLFSTRFIGAVNFGLRIHGTADFSYCVFESNATFSYCHFDSKASFQDATFEGRSTFLVGKFVDEVVFTNAEFAKEARFLGTAHDRLFISRVWFRFVKAPSGLVFEDVDLSATTFLTTDLEHVTFTNVTWFRQGQRRALIDERPTSRDRRADSANRQWASERLAENYRQLVINHERKRDYPAASDFHVGEMETLRRRKRFPLNLYAVYRVASTYGTSYARAFAVLVCLVIAFAAAFMVSGIYVRDQPARLIKYSFSSQSSLPSPATFLRDLREAVLFVLSLFGRDRFYEPFGWESRLLASAAIFLLTSQGALLLLAIRRQFGR